MVYQCKPVVKFGGITSDFQWYTTGISVVSSGITSGISVVSSGISVVSSGEIWCYYQWYTSGITCCFQWKSVVKFGGFTTVLNCLTMEITGITSVLPLKSTVLPVVITPNFTADFDWYTTGNTNGIPLVNPETFSMGK